MHNYEMITSKYMFTLNILPQLKLSHELGDDRMSLRNVDCKLCGCSTSLKYQLKCKFPVTLNLVA